MIFTSKSFAIILIGNPLIDRFNEGGPFFMSLILICLLLTIFFIIKSSLALKKHEPKFKKYLSLIGEAGLLGLVIGVLGSVIGMIEAFDAIESFETAVSQGMIAGGLKVSFLTLIFGVFAFIISRIAIISLKWMFKSNSMIA